MTAAGARASALARAGVPVRAVIDPRREVPQAADGGACERPARNASPGHVVTASSGGKALASIKVEVFDATTGSVSGAARELKCDALAVAAGWSPLVHLASQAGGPPQYDEAIHAFLPGDAREKLDRGRRRAAACSRQTRRRPKARAPARTRPRHAASTPRQADTRPAEDRSAAAPENLLPLFEIPAKGKAFVDLQNDVTAADVRLARREGFESVEHLKRYTTLGMAADQGKTSNLNGLTILAKARGLPVPAVGTTRFRPPYNPVSLGALVGARARQPHASRSAARRSTTGTSRRARR